MSFLANKAVYKKKSSIICVYNIYKTSLKKSKQRKHGPKTAPDGATNTVFSGVTDSFGVIFFNISIEDVFFYLNIKKYNVKIVRSSWKHNILGSAGGSFWCVFLLFWFLQGGFIDAINTEYRCQFLYSALYQKHATNDHTRRR